MPRELPKTDEGTEYIQFRGRQTSVYLDDLGVHFTTEKRSTPEDHPGLLAHKPLPVADRDDIRAGEAPENAIAREVAEAITDGDLANPLICWGVVCEHTEDGEVCGQAFATPESLNGHLAKHYSSTETASESDAGGSE